MTWVSWRQKWPATQLFVQQFVRANNKESIKVLHYWYFVHRWPRSWPVDSGGGFHLNESFMRKAVPYYDIIMSKLPRVRDATVSVAVVLVVALVITIPGDEPVGAGTSAVTVLIQLSERYRIIHGLAQGGLLIPCVLGISVWSVYC